MHLNRPDQQVANEQAHRDGNGSALRDSDPALSNTKTYSGRTDFGKKLITETAESNWTLSNIACTGKATDRKSYV